MRGDELDSSGLAQRAVRQGYVEPALQALPAAGEQPTQRVPIWRSPLEEEEEEKAEEEEEEEEETCDGTSRTPGRKMLAIPYHLPHKIYTRLTTSASGWPATHPTGFLSGVPWAPWPSSSTEDGTSGTPTSTWSATSAPA